MSMVIFWLALYFFIIIIIGTYSSRIVKDNVNEYYVAGRRQPWWMVAGTHVSTHVGVASFLGLVAATYGLGLSVFSMTMVGHSFILGALFLGLRFRRQKSMTLPDFLGDRYDCQKVRFVSAIIMLVAFCAYAGMGIVGAGLIFEVVLGIPYIYGVLLVAVIFIAYSVAGGVLAVVYTDFIQALVMIACSLALVLFAVAGLGGFKEVVGNVLEQQPAWFTWNLGGARTGWVYAMAFTWALGNFARPDAVTRYVTARSERDVVKAVIATLCCTAFIYLFIVPWLGTTIRAAFPPGALADVEQGYIFLALEYMPAVLVGVALAGLLASAMSSVDSQLMMSSMAISRDIYQRIFRPDVSGSKLIFISRMIVITVGIVSTLIAVIRPVFMVEFLNIIFFFFGGALFASLVLGAIWSRATKEGAFWSMVVGGVLSITVNFKPTLLGPIPMLVVGGVSIAIMVIVSLLTKPTENTLKVWRTISTPGLGEKTGQSTGA